MFKKISGILILLSFLLVKSTPLFAADNFKHTIVSNAAEQQEADDTPDADKESKQLETVDEDFIQESMAVRIFLILSKSIVHSNTPYISTPYISLPSPPPNGTL